MAGRRVRVQDNVRGEEKCDTSCDLGDVSELTPNNGKISATFNVLRVGKLHF